jgi:CRP/FNR family transcriptional regulator, cyclic AMP receptor protein
MSFRALSPLTDESGPASLEGVLFGSVLSAKRETVLFSQGDVANAVFYVLSGKLKITSISQKGREAILGIVAPGEFVGECCLLQSLRRTSAIALTDCTLSRVNKVDLLRLFGEERRLLERFTFSVIARNIRVEDALADQLLNSSKQRLARILLYLANTTSGGQEAIIERMSQAELAEMVGTTRARVNHFMRMFRKSGFIDYDGRRIIVRPSLQSVITGDR